MRKVHALLLASLVLPFTVLTAHAANEGVIRDMQKVISGDARLTEDQQQQFRDVVQAALAQRDPLGEDKQKYAGEHLRAYLDDILADPPDNMPLFYEVAKKTLEWNLGNYATLPPITETQRSAAVKSISAIQDGVRKFINDTYSDTPADVREKIYGRVVTQMGGLAANVGNYFYPQYLYASDKVLDEAAVVEQLGTSSFLQDNGGKFASVNSILQDNSLAEKSRLGHLEFYIVDQVDLLSREAKRAYRHAFRGPPADAYAYLPDDLKVLYQQLFTKMNELAKENHDHFLQRIEHESLVQSLMAQSGFTMKNGVAIPTSVDAASETGDTLIGQNVDVVVSPHVLGTERETAPNVLTSVPPSGSNQSIYLLYALCGVAGVGVLLYLIRKRFRRSSV
jgi:hypothetical protein